MTVKFAFFFLGEVQVINVDLRVFGFGLRRRRRWGRKCRRRRSVASVARSQSGTQLLYISFVHSWLRYRRTTKQGVCICCISCWSVGTNDFLFLVFLLRGLSS